MPVGVRRYYTYLGNVRNNTDTQVINHLMVLMAMVTATATVMVTAMATVTIVAVMDHEDI